MKIGVKGATGESSKVFIELQLEDAGFVGCEYDVSLKKLKIPDIYREELDEIAMSIAETGDYLLELDD
ncbi:hypothetical protein H6763_00545 [Candidatus Nomurabacteria bacterium]|uniref:Uncharacterized protein n=1 Tax=Candidatus Dojkabacteria bacterium TaxID=2099670 RepID=A0A955KWF5_9BACT|nr:hypothetical protein [Candidatus Dojkabacteria bacterium]MCB9790178.1 hypothetical protein [Candidatus Nomurabacteria bacterium]MCB9803302.1 hypothetical protein [Candidatus Nomurabacteria bacterium]